MKFFNLSILVLAAAISSVATAKTLKCITWKTTADGKTVEDGDTLFIDSKGDERFFTFKKDNIAIGCSTDYLSHFIHCSGGIVGSSTTNKVPFKSLSDSISVLEEQVMHSHYLYTKKYTFIVVCSTEQSKPNTKAFFSNAAKLSRYKVIQR